MDSQLVKVIDSHTEGEPTRIVVAGAPDLGAGTMEERLRVFREQHDDFRSAVVCEPRGSDVVVGALLLEPNDASCTAAVIFFNDVGYLGMCGHGTIGLVTTLAHMGRIAAGVHRIETPVGTVAAELHEDGSVTVTNVASYRFRKQVAVEVPAFGRFVGDIAWGGNWFFLIGEQPFELTAANRLLLLGVTIAIREALHESGITGPKGEALEHVELFSAPADARNSSRNFVLCPGAAFDRSPCGTGTSAKLACLYAEGRLTPGEVWRQEGILGTVFEGTVEGLEGLEVRPRIRGRAWITGEATLRFDATDPFVAGIRY